MALFSPSTAKGLMLVSEFVIFLYRTQHFSIVVTISTVLSYASKKWFNLKLVDTVHTVPYHSKSIHTYLYNTVTEVEPTGQR